MLFDLHNDFPTAISAEKYESAICGGVRVTSVIWTSEFDGECVRARVDGMTARLKKLDVPIAIEDIGFLSRGNEYEQFDFSKYFYCSLTWNYDNAFAGGALDCGKLTNVGKCAIKYMNGKCAVDVAHLNRDSFYAVLDIAERPICSHTGFNSHPRSLGDEQIRALISRRAPIGMSTVTKFTDAYTAKQFAVAIDRFVSRYGADTLCIGTDFYGTTDTPTDLKSYADFPSVRDELGRLGYSNADIDSIFYGNALRFYEEIQHDRHL